MKKYSQEYLNQMPLISNSNHRVYSDGNVFYKRSRSDQSASNIVLEAQVNEILGLESKLVPGPPVSILSERLGQSLRYNEIRESFVREAIRVMADNHYLSDTKTSHIASLAPSWNNFRDSMEEKIRYRINSQQNPELLLNILPQRITCSKYNLGLVHSDPRPANWLRRDDGTLILIDWESAVIAPWEFAVVSFASYLFEYGRSDLAFFALEEAHENHSMNTRLLEWSANYRTAATSSWYFANEGFDSGMKWVNKMSQLWIDLGF